MKLLTISVTLLVYLPENSVSAKVVLKKFLDTFETFIVQHNVTIKVTAKTKKKNSIRLCT